LFGEQVQLKPTVPEPEVKPTTPGYMVEPPRPVTSVRPPPPEFPNDWRANAPPEPAAVVEAVTDLPAQTEPIALPPTPPLVDLPAVIREAVTFAPPAEDPTGSAQVRRPMLADAPPMPIFVPQTAPPPPAPPPAAPPPPVSPYGQTEMLELSQFVDQLYQNVADETSDSATLNAECLMNLNAARAAIEKGAYSKAEASAELVKARLLRARASVAAAATPTTRFLLVGLVLGALVGLLLFAIPFLFRIVPVVIPLLRGVGLGMLGGAAMALYQLATHIARREYDAGFNNKYALSPLFGALLGGVLYLLSISGILAAPNALGIPVEYAFMYVVALLAGLFNDVIIGALREWVARRGAPEGI
jgi:hypothetical protein